MAEQVQAALDQMVAPLADLQERNVFTPEEIHAIVTRRRQAEYLLRRLTVRKQDFLRYIQDETRLEELRQLRMKRMRREEHKTRNKANHHHHSRDQEITKHIGDKHILQWIHLLWKRTFRKFRSDQSLYLQYAEFLKKQHSHVKLSELYASVLQIFPKQAGWWIEAASHEYFVSGSLQTARVLLQRGLRINPNSIELWLQSFTLELHFVQKMQGRRQILMLSGGSATGGVGGGGQDSTSSASEKNKDDDNNNKAATMTTTEDVYKIARLVHDNAVAALPKSVSLRLQFLQQCQQFPNTDSLKQHILDALQRDCCQDSPVAWIAAAQSHMELLATTKTPNKLEQRAGFLAETAEEDTTEPPTKKQKSGAVAKKSDVTTRDPVVALMREATTKIRTHEMYLQAIRLLLNYQDHLQESLEEDEEEKDDDDDDDDENQNERDEETLAKLKSCQRLLEKLFKEASKLKDYSHEIVLEHVDYLLGSDRMSAAIAKLESFAKTSTKAVIWRRWAYLSLQHAPKRGEVKALNILNKGLAKIPIANSSDHMHLLLQLLGLKLATSAKDSWGVMERILLLAPGCDDVEDLEDPEFGLTSVADACLQFLLDSISTKTIKEVRKTYQAVLFESSLLKHMLSQEHAQFYKHFIDAAIKAEAETVSTKQERRKRLERLFETAITAFKGTPLEYEYQKRRDNEVRYGDCRVSSRKATFDTSTGFSVPTLDASSIDFSAPILMELYEKYQVVHIKNVSRRHTGNCLTWRNVGRLFNRLDASDQQSWCIEQDDDESEPTPESFLRPSITAHRAYCSFLVQKDDAAYDHLLKDKLPFVEFEGTDWCFEKALWLFFGRNPVGSGANLPGRPDHTDSVSHDGTFHWQLSGTKQWHIHPSSELTKRNSDLDTATQVSAACHEGDILMLNTRLWFHRTEIPPQGVPSVSYARDFRFQASNNVKENHNMTNVDGLYATEPIDEGTVIFTEHDMPDCELHRSSVNPNCKVADLEDGTSAVVSLRAIAAGEFFCVPESDDEEGDVEIEDDD